MLLFLCILLPCLAFIRVNPKTGFFVDETGRSVIYHGVNVVYKIPPFYPSYETFNSSSSLSPFDAANLRKWGFNAVRLYVAWQGVQPSKGVIDYDYLEHIKAIVSILEAESIHAILDCHQDVLNPFFCGEGIPDWTVDRSRAANFPSPLPFDLPKDPKTGKPSVSDCTKHGFSSYYFTEAVSMTFQELYTKDTLLRNSFIEFWTAVAKYFSDNENILGYELLNEPWFGDIFHHPSVLLGGVTDRDLLAPLYTELFHSIDLVDSNHILFYEPSVGEQGKVGFTSCPFDDSPFRCALSWHVYCFDRDHEGDPRSRAVCEGYDDHVIDDRVRDASRLKSASFTTEFGSLRNDSKAIAEIEWVLQSVESKLSSWSYWQFKWFYDYTTSAFPNGVDSFYDFEGNLEVNKVRTLSRTFFQKTCGVPLSSSFHPETSEFLFSFTVDLCGGNPSVLYLNEELNYPNGYVLETVPKGVFATISSPRLNYVHLTLNTTVASIGSKVEVEIRRK